ncbi:primase C-terminal domain-containing protein [Aliarcobacter skirrowii]|uniref:primase C-terminal domain-containing protein n=1 Tax=Aliarcobacter skirrowii TaxID=28200 RepID=UPI00082CAC19|nr:primase C-terminal domain-containing protein [Aliarcobacter skirrowii]
MELKTKIEDDGFLNFKPSLKAALKELIIKSSPSLIKAGNTKTGSNVEEFKTPFALDTKEFINFNTKERIDFLIFDIDKVGNLDALEYFKRKEPSSKDGGYLRHLDGNFDFVERPPLETFLNFLKEELGEELTPSFITQTKRGFQFCYHLKLPVLTNNKKALEYLKNIKKGLTKKLKLDEIASNRLHGVWRNPLLHHHIFLNKYNFKLEDFKKFAIKKENENKIKFRDFIKDIKLENFEVGNRNNALFKKGLNFAYPKKNLKEEEIFEYLEKLNRGSLETKEVSNISKSVFKYYKEGNIKIFEVKENRGAMDFEPIKKNELTQEEIEREIKYRQSEAAYRSIKIRDTQKNNNALEKAREIKAEKNYHETIKKIKIAKEILEKENKKISKLALANLTKLSRKTIIKYYNEI